MSDLEARARVKRVGLTRKPFSGHLSGVRFEATPEGVYFEGAVLSDVDFSGLRIDFFHVRGSTFERCDFSRAVLRVGSLSVSPPSVYRDCRFDGADLREVDPGLAQFERCTFDRVKIDGWRCTHNSFIDCHFAGRMRKVDFSGGRSGDPTMIGWASGPRNGLLASRQPNEFRGNDFRDAIFEDVDFICGIDVDAQILPEDPAYVRLDCRSETIDHVEAYAKGLAPEEQANALALLPWLRNRYGSQTKIFARRMNPHGSLGLYEELLARMGK